MKIASISTFRKDIKRYVDEVSQDLEPLVVTRPDNISVVVIPLETYNAYVETDYLLRSPENAARLRTSLKEARAGKTKRQHLTED